MRLFYLICITIHLCFQAQHDPSFLNEAIPTWREVWDFEEVVHFIGGVQPGIEIKVLLNHLCRLAVDRAIQHIRKGEKAYISCIYDYLNIHVPDIMTHCVMPSDFQPAYNNQLCMFPECGKPISADLPKSRLYMFNELLDPSYVTILQSQSSNRVPAGPGNSNPVPFEDCVICVVAIHRDIVKDISDICSQIPNVTDVFIKDPGYVGDFQLSRNACTLVTPHCSMQLSAQLSTTSDIERLSLRHPVEELGVKPVLENVRHMHKLRYLHLASYGSGGMPPNLISFKLSPSLQHISLKSYLGTSVNCKIFCDQLRHLHHLEYVNLSYNPLDESISGLIDALKGSPTRKPLIEYIYLSNCQIRHSESKALLATLTQCSNLLELDLSGNILTGCLDGFMANPPPLLREMNFDSTALNEQDIEGITQAFLKKKLTRLCRLSIEGLAFNIFRCGRAPALVSAVVKNITIGYEWVHLYLPHINRDDRDELAIEKQLYDISKGTTVAIHV